MSDNTLSRNETIRRLSDVPELSNEELLMNIGWLRNLMQSAYVQLRNNAKDFNQQKSQMNKLRHRIYQSDKEIGILKNQLEQATADKNELMEGLEDMHEQLERCMGSHEKLEAACHRLKEGKRKLHAVHDENYAKAAHRAGVIEELRAANLERQKQGAQDV